MQYSFLITSILCIAYSPVYASNSYQSEFAYTYNNLDSSDGTERTINDIGLTYYFSPVDTKSHPLREAAFLEMASGFSISYSGDRESGTFANTNIDYFETTFQYIIKDQPMPISLTAEYSKEYFNFDQVSFEYDAVTAELGIGAYVLNDTLISLFYSEIEAKFSPSRKTEVDAYNVEVKSVREMGNNTAFSITGNIIKNDITVSSSSGLRRGTRSSVYLLNGTYYLNRKNGIGVQLSQSKNNRSSLESKGYDLFADIFLTNQYSIRFTLGKLSASGSGVTSLDADDDIISISFLGRI